MVELASGFTRSRMCEEKYCKDRAENGTIPAVLGIGLDENHLKVPGIDEATGRRNSRVRRAKSKP